MSGNGRGAPLGNRNATKGRPWREALDRALKRDKRGLLDKAALMLLEAAASGDLDAIKELGNRLDGRPGQRVEITDDRSMTQRLLEAENRYLRAMAGKVIEGETLRPGEAPVADDSLTRLLR